MEEERLVPSGLFNHANVQIVALRPGVVEIRVLYQKRCKCRFVAMLIRPGCQVECVTGGDHREGEVEAQLKSLLVNSIVKVF